MEMGLSAVTMGHEIENTQFLISFVSFNLATSANGDCYATSSYVQPQQFQINSESTDSVGTSYGTVAAGKFGPRGAIVTFKPYIYRRPIVHGVDQLYIDGNTGFNTGVLTVVSETMCDPYFFPNIVNSQSHAIWQELFCNNTSVGENNPSYCGMLDRSFLGQSFCRKWGTYSVDQDTFLDVQATTDQVGEVARAPVDGNGNPKARDANNLDVVRNPYYDITRHYWA